MKERIQYNKESVIELLTNYIVESSKELSPELDDLFNNIDPNSDDYEMKLQRIKHYKELVRQIITDFVWPNKDIPKHLVDREKIIKSLYRLINDITVDPFMKKLLKSSDYKFFDMVANFNIVQSIMHAKDYLNRPEIRLKDL